MLLQMMKMMMVMLMIMTVTMKKMTMMVMMPLTALIRMNMATTRSLNSLRLVIPDYKLKKRSITRSRVTANLNPPTPGCLLVPALGDFRR